MFPQHVYVNRGHYAMQTIVQNAIVILVCKNERNSKMAEAYCVKCKTKREIKDPQEVTMKNGRPAIRGTCKVCGTTVQIFQSEKKA
jgi:hypothetical protein